MNKTYKITPPSTEQELLDRAAALAGKTIAHIATQLSLPVPDDQKHHKGWIGNLAERYLGATAMNRSEPDFQELGIELKSVPMSRPNVPRESTYVCTVNLIETTNISWETSPVYMKLKRVLWLPVESDQSIAVKDRRFGSAILWSPDKKQEEILKNDWEEIMDLICLGEIDRLSSSQGVYLQVRPKAANSSALGKSYSEDGRPATTLPRGFYLRTSFTRTLFASEE